MTNYTSQITKQFQMTGKVKAVSKEPDRKT